MSPRSRRTSSLLATALAVALAGSGCGADRGPGSSAAPAPPAAPTPGSPSPASAPPGSAAPSSPVPTSSGPPARPALTDSELKKALLTLKDLPAGFQVEPAAGQDDRARMSAGGRPCAALVELFNEDRLAGAVGHAATSFSGGQDGPFVEETLESWSASSGAAATVAGYRKAVKACDRVRLQVPGVGSGSLAVRPVSFGEIGDSLFAARLTGEEGPLEGFELLQVAAQSGGVVVGMGFVFTDPADAEAATEDAVAKVEKVLKTAASPT